MKRKYYLLAEVAIHETHFIGSLCDEDQNNNNNNDSNERKRNEFQLND